MTELNREHSVWALNRNPDVSTWMRRQVQTLIDSGYISTEHTKNLCDHIVTSLSDYAVKHNIKSVVVGMSGGIDSAVTAALFKRAGYTVIGVTMPIHQNPAETERGIEACEALGIEHVNVDLTQAYDDMIRNMKGVHSDIEGNSTHSAIRRGNVRARLRMITLYDLASLHKGFVASTDNYSELAAGFWTLHGDVGDVSPIQSLTKSWEVPALAVYLGVPQSIVKAVPTDGLGIANGDEDQFGFSYLEFDTVLLCLTALNTADQFEVWTKDCEPEDLQLIQQVKDRIANSTHKRNNPFNIQHPQHDRYVLLEKLDTQLKGE